MTLASKIDRDGLVALAAWWFSEPDGFYLQLDAYASRPSAEHPRLARTKVAVWRCGDWTAQPTERSWPEIEAKRVEWGALADELGVPLHFPPEPYPDDTMRAWWAMWDDPEPRRYTVGWRVRDATTGAERATEGDLEAEGASPADVFELAIAAAEGTPVGDDVLDRTIEVWTDIQGERVSTRRLLTIRARVSDPTVALFSEVGRGELALSTALRRLIDDHGVSENDAALLVIDSFDSDVSEGTIYRVVDAFVRGEASVEGLEASLGGKLRLKEGLDAD